MLNFHEAAAYRNRTGNPSDFYNIKPKREEAEIWAGDQPARLSKNKREENEKTYRFSVTTLSYPVIVKK